MRYTNKVSIISRIFPYEIDSNLYRQHRGVDGLTAVFRNNLSLNSNSRPQALRCVQAGNLKITPVQLKYDDASHYRDVFFPLVVVEAEDQEKTQKTRIIENVGLNWKVENGLMCFQIPYEKAEELKLKRAKEVSLKYTGTMRSWWEATGRIIELPQDNDKDEFVVKLSGDTCPRKRETQLVSLGLVWCDVKTSRMISALEKFSLQKYCMHNEIFNSILGNRSKSKLFKFKIPEHYQAENLNPLNHSQLTAVKSALKKTLTLIQGPPGTGKTVVAATIVDIIIKCAKVKILVCASSNVAVDNLAEKLHKTEMKVVRICSQGIENEYKSKEFPTLHTMEKEILNFKLGLNEPHSVNNWAIDEYFDGRSKGVSIKDFIIDNADVVVYTCIGSGDPGLGHQRFHTIIVDEATQATEPECLIPIVKGCERLVLIGDHKQLGPVVADDGAKAAGYNQSLFERFIKLSYPVNDLNQQYRMHPGIAAFPSEEFYQSDLLNGINAQDRLRPQSKFPWPNPKYPVMFLSNLDQEAKLEKGFSFCNRSEVVKCVEVIRELLRDGVASSRISVITFYEGQRILINQTLMSLLSKVYIEVVNVDAFQGREKDYIIISCVRSNSERKIGFLTCPRRLNVALTRAKYGLIMIGNPHTLSRDQLWYRLLNFIKDRKSLVSGPFHQPKPYNVPLNSTIRFT